jgi:hypothetical protein
VSEARSLLGNRPKLIKSFGAQIWQHALSSQDQKSAVDLLINLKAPVYLPSARAKKVSANSCYTLSLGLKYKSLALVKYLLDNYKINSSIVDNGIIQICNVTPFSEQIEMLQLLIDQGGSVNAKNHRAMYNATLNENGDLIKTLVENGASIINHKCSDLFLVATNQDPLSYLSVCTDELSQTSVMSSMSFDKPNDRPLEHFE